MRIAFLLITIFIIGTMNSDAQDSKPALIYIGDPMCSWCYGFAEELSAIKDSTKNDLEFITLMSGLRPDENHMLTDELKTFLKDHWQHIEDLTGQEFNYGIMEWQDWAYNTEPACRAVITVREMAPELTFPFFKKVQEGFYRDNINTNQSASFASIAEEMGIDRVEFLKSFNSDHMKQSTQADFELVRSWGVTGFPTLLLRTGDGNVYKLASGYSTAKELNETISGIIGESQ